MQKTLFCFFLWWFRGMLLSLQAFKQYNTPSVRVVLLDEADLIVTSNGSDNKETLSVNLNSDVDGASKAPNRSIWGDD